MIVEHSFGVRIVCICQILFELRLMEKKERKKKERRQKKKNKIEIFAFDFLDCKEKSWDSGAIFCIRIAKGFHLLEFASLHSVYLGAAPIP